jgi:iron complex outermembrane receptor protein
MSRAHLFFGTASAAAALLALFPISAFAQAPAATTAQAGGLEEIVVTAQRREEKLHNVPIAVTALTAAAIQARGISNINDIAGFAPNVTFVQSPSFDNETTVAIRGGVTINPAPYWEPAVGMYVDGVYIDKAQGNVFDLVDIDHIEILRGPQGTLYGRNTLSGAVNFVTQKPTGVFGGDIQATFGNYDLEKGRLSVNLPEFGKLKVKVTGLIESRGGFQQFAPDPFHLPAAITTPATVSEYNATENKAARIAARLDITDDLTADYTFDMYYRHDIPQQGQLVSIGQGGIFDPGSAAYLGIPLYLYVQHSPDAPFHYATASVNNAALFENSGARAHGLTLTWDPSEEFILKSITSYRWQDWSISQNFDNSPMEIARTQQFSHYHTFTQELQASGQIDRLHYTVGAFYFNDGGHDTIPQQFFFGSVNINSQFGFSSEAYAVYGQVEYNPPILDDRLTLTAGLRYNNEDKVGDRSVSGEVPYTTASKSFDDATPTFIVKYDITPDLNVYAKYAEGFKSGGFNGEASSAQEARTPFRPETVDEYEVGAKSRWLDGKLEANVAFFYDDRKDMQLAVFTGQGALATIIRNAGSAVIDGTELELNALPTDWVRLSGTVGYLNTFYNEFIEGGRNVADDRAFPVAPQFTAHAGADFTLMDDDEIGKLHFLVDYNHSDAYYYYPYSLSTNPAINLGYYAGSTKASPLNTIDARLRLADIPTSYGTVDVAMWGRNIFNDKAKVSGIDFGPAFGNLNVAYYNNPPTFGADVVFHFGGVAPEPAAPPAAYVPPPAAAPAPAPRNYMVFFDFNKSDLTAQATQIVDQAAQNAGAQKATQLTVTGHTDTVGSDAYNMRLSRRRAESVAAELEKQGVAAGEIAIVAKGKRDLLVPTGDGVREPQNRRVQIVFDDGGRS